MGVNVEINTNPSFSVQHRKVAISWACRPEVLSLSSQLSEENCPLLPGLHKIGESLQSLPFFGQLSRCPSPLSVAMISTMTKSYVGRKGFVSLCRLHSPEGKLGQELKEGAWRQGLKHTHIRTLLTASSSMAC